MNSATSSVKRTTLWAAMLAPVAAWACEGTSGLLLTYEACHDDRRALVRAFVIVSGGVALCVALAAGAVARRSLRQLGVATRPYRAEGVRNDESMALWALASATLFGLAAIWTALPFILMQRVCEAGR
jgi:hypothetical protein